jgi:hypothetical protein
MRQFLWIAVLWLFLAGVVMIEGSWVPRSGKGWFLLVAFGPPAYVIVSAAAESGMNWLYSSRLFRIIERQPSSLVRIGGAVLFFVVTTLLFFGAVYGAFRLYSWGSSFLLDAASA